MRAVEAEARRQEADQRRQQQESVPYRASFSAELKDIFASLASGFSWTSQTTRAERISRFCTTLPPSAATTWQVSFVPPFSYASLLGPTK